MCSRADPGNASLAHKTAEYQTEAATITRARDAHTWPGDLGRARNLLNSSVATTVGGNCRWEVITEAEEKAIALVMMPYAAAIDNSRKLDRRLSDVEEYLPRVVSSWGEYVDMQVQRPRRSQGRPRLPDREAGGASAAADQPDECARGAGARPVLRLGERGQGGAGAGAEGAALRRRCGVRGAAVTYRYRERRRATA